MAISTITVTLTNTNENPQVLAGAIDTTVISPTPITTPDTPYVEYVADATTVLDGSISVPAWKKLQYFVIPTGNKFSIQTDCYDEAIYYANLKIAGLNVTVSPDPITVVTVTLSDSTATISGTGTKALTATTVPEGATVTWSSSNEAVATVSNGTVTGVSAGTAVIKASIDSDGAKASATCTVTVS